MTAFVFLVQRLEVAQVSKPVYRGLPSRQDARDVIALFGFGNPRYSRLRSLRYMQTFLLD